MSSPEPTQSGRWSGQSPGLSLIHILSVSKDGKGPAPLGPVREIFGYGIFAVTTIALILQSSLGFDNWQIAMTGAALVLVTGVLNPQEAIKAIPVRIVLMLVSALAVGGAMEMCIRDSHKAWYG